MAAGKILGVMSDLFFSVKIMDAAKPLGLTVEFVKEKALALEKFKEQPAIVIFDLNCMDLDSNALIHELKSNPETKWIPALGFVAHVQADVKQQALDNGCDVVVARSVFAQRLPELLRTQLAEAV